jgi:hypothetical protein
MKNHLEVNAMSRVIEYIKKNYLFVGIILLVIILLVVLVTVRLNKKELTWEPIEGEVSYDIKRHEANEYKIITVEDQDISIAYYKNWVYLLINKPEEAYTMLSKRSLKEYPTYEKFKEWVDRYVTVKTKDSTLTGYKYEEKGGHNEIVVSTSEHMRYRFNEYSVWNYKVDIIGQERVIDKSTTITTKKK